MLNPRHLKKKMVMEKYQLSGLPPDLGCIQLLSAWLSEENAHHLFRETKETREVKGDNQQKVAEIECDSPM
jgi:hypothetical protein